MLFDEDAMSMEDWLSVIHLEQYTDHFTQNRYQQVSDCWGIRNEDLSRIGVFLPGHRKRILSALNKCRQGALTPEPPQQATLTPDPPPEPSEKPIPKKRNIYLCNQHPVSAVQIPSEKPLPPIPPRQSPGRPPERLTPVPRPRCTPKAALQPPSSPPAQVPVAPPSETHRRDLPLPPPRQDVPTGTKPLLPPIPMRPPARFTPPADSSSTCKINLDECKTELKSLPVAPRTKPSLPPLSILDPSSLPNLLVCCSTYAEHPRCETQPDNQLLFPVEMADKDSICRTPCSDITDAERSSAGESPSSFFSDDDNADDYEMMLDL
ncbi:uncharacterized protein [Scyliorhinus torazame]|uniref:uncharacterized protein n=1 Tax=Scyliorhinus torazame TaxID=75743 RepID=UPI003B58F3E4